MCPLSLRPILQCAGGIRQYGVPKSCPISGLPGVEDGNVEGGEVGDVAGDDGEVVVKGGCGEQTIDHRERLSCAPGSRG